MISRDRIGVLVRIVQGHGQREAEGRLRPPFEGPKVDSVEATIEKIQAYGGEIVQPIGADAPEIIARFRDPGGQCARALSAALTHDAKSSGPNMMVSTRADDGNRPIAFEFLDTTRSPALGLGIGANTTKFSVVDTALLKRLDFPSQTVSSRTTVCDRVS